MNFDKVLITGATGKVGEAVTRHLLRETNLNLVLFTSGSDLNCNHERVKQYKVDYTDKKQLKKICFIEEPYWIVNAAAYTDVDGCEDNRKDCMDMNLHLVEILSQVCRIMESHIITFSTDYIFDGEDGPYSENSKPNPLSYYGKSKLAGENACRTIALNHTVVRTNIVYGSSSYGKNDFIKWLVNNLDDGKNLNIITGQWGNPTLSDDLALMVNKIIEKNRIGIYNAGGKDWINRYEIALEVAEVFGYDKSLINPVAPDTFKQKAIRPERGGLINLKAETDLGMKFSSLKKGLLVLKQYMDK